jgi:hypothetical protein
MLCLLSIEALFFACLHLVAYQIHLNEHAGCNGGVTASGEIGASKQKGIKFCPRCHNII